MVSPLVHVVLITYRVPLAEIDAHLPAHREWLEAGYVGGTFVDSGPRVPRTGGVLLVRGVDRDTVLLRLAEDPFALAGVADYEVVSYESRGLAV